MGGVKRTKPYVLCDGIYPAWDVLLLALAKPISAAEKLFTKKQESARKDIERAFGVMRKRWEALRKACLKKDKEKIICMMNSMIALHNLIIEFNEGRRQADFLVEEMEQDQEAFRADTEAWQADRDQMMPEDLHLDQAEPDDNAPMRRLRELFNAERHAELREGVIRDLAEKEL